MSAVALSGVDTEATCRVIGLVGFGLYVIGFFHLCLGRLDSSGQAYFALVLVAAICVLISLTADFNLSAALIQGFYILMALGGIVLRRRQRRTPLARARSGTA